jgi:hypothetical protein
MPKFTLKEGAHYHGMPPFSTLPWVGEKAISRYVTFSPECRYDSADYNSQDVNKLFGLSFGFGGVHGNSARFGWRWSNSDQCIELLAYVYVDGVRNQDAQLRFPVVAQVGLGETVKCTVGYLLLQGKPEYCFWVQSIAPVPNAQIKNVVVPLAASLPGFGLTHGLYFGGELTAPHTMTVQIDRL